jgi:hypothetical protein
MRYEKPELVSRTEAARAIQGQGKEGPIFDNVPAQTLETVPAYEADE